MVRVKALSQARRDDETRSYDNCSFPVSFSCDLRVKYALWFLEVQTAVNVNMSLCCIRIANHRRTGLVPPQSFQHATQLVDLESLGVLSLERLLLLSLRSGRGAKYCD